VWVSINGLRKRLCRVVLPGSFSFLGRYAVVVEAAHKERVGMRVWEMRTS
jgi:hypothetical protein